MFTTGSRLLVGATVLATIAAVVYGLTQDGALGTIGLISAAIGLALLTGVNMYARDSFVSAMDPAARTRSSAAAGPPGASMWPIVAAVGAALVVVGLVTYPVVTIFGIIVIIGATAEWMVQAWSERASGNVHHNAEVRERIAHPLEFPVLAAVGLGIIIYSFSRIMLVLSKSTGPAVFFVIAALILLVGFVVAFRPSIRTGGVAVVAVVAALGLVAGGVAAALDGERSIHPHETTDDLAAEGKCDTPEHTEVDEHASQSVAAKANINGEIFLRADGTLEAKNLGVTGYQDFMVVTRANTTNVMFRNQSDEDRRLVLDLGTRPEIDEEGNEIEGTEMPNQVCTQLAEDDGSQLLTFTIPVPTELADTDYFFFVPGVEGAELPVQVP